MDVAALGANLFHSFLEGQRAVFGIVDQQLTRGIFDFMDMAVRDFIAAGETIDATIIHRYLAGEFTNGVVPLERQSWNFRRLQAVEAFATVLELLRLRVDGPIPLPKPESKEERLFRGRFGPYVLCRVKNEKRALCWRCRTEAPYDLVMLQKKPEPCPKCGAIDLDGTDSGIDGGTQPD